jgi:hypothetical protein
VCNFWKIGCNPYATPVSMITTQIQLLRTWPSSNLIHMYFFLVATCKPCLTEKALLQHIYNSTTNMNDNTNPMVKDLTELDLFSSGWVLAMALWFFPIRLFICKVGILRYHPSIALHYISRKTSIRPNILLHFMCVFLWCRNLFDANSCSFPIM